MNRVLNFIGSRVIHPFSHGRSFPEVFISKSRMSCHKVLQSYLEIWVQDFTA